MVAQALATHPPDEAQHMQNKAKSERRHRGLLRLWGERRANVAVLSSMLMPVFMGAAGLGVEASNWGVLESELQRTADAAALAGAVAYNASGNAQTAANAAADVAELNGMPSGTRHWTSGTKTLTDGVTTIQQVTGLRNTTDVAYQVSVTKSVPLAFAKLFVAPTSYTIPAQSTAELIATSSAQPCVLGLKGVQTGDTTSVDVGLSGTSTITGTNCSVRSNGKVTLSGTSSITANSVYAGGSITTSGVATIHATKYANDGQIPDPYANNDALQTALGKLGTCSSCTNSVSLSGTGTQTIAGSNYNNISVSGTSTLTIGPNTGPVTLNSLTVTGSSTLNLSPGLYVVNGPISVSGTSTINAGGGVTIVSSGAVSLSGTSSSLISAPGTSPTNGAVPGVAIAGTTTSATSISGTSGLEVTGVVYFPNSTLSFSGTSGNPTSPCLELIANTVTMSGTADLGANCSSLGAVSFGSINSASAALVQ